MDRYLRYQHVSLNIQSCGDIIICFDNARKADRHHADRYVLEEYGALLCRIYHAFYSGVDHTQNRRFEVPCVGDNNHVKTFKSQLLR